MSNNVTGNVSVCDINRVHSDWLAKCDAAVISALENWFRSKAAKSLHYCSFLFTRFLHSTFLIERIERCVKYKISAL